MGGGVAPEGSAVMDSFCQLVDERIRLRIGMIRAKLLARI